MNPIALTDVARKLLLQHRLYTHDGAFNLAHVYRIVGPLDVPRLRGVLEEILTTNPTLNMTFTTEDSVDVAVITKGEVEVAVRSVPGHLDRQAEADHVTRDVGRRAEAPFPPDRWPLHDVALYQGEHAGYLTIICSHLISDAITLFNLVDLVSELYAGHELSGPLRAALVDEPEPEPDRVRDAAPGVAAFRELLAGVTRLTHEQLSTPRMAGGVLPGRRHEWPLDTSLAAELRRSPLVAAHGAFTVFVAAHAVVLSALTGQSTVVIGIPMATRSGRRQMYQLGYFINTLPLALDLTSFDTFGQLCEGVAARITTMLRHRQFDLTAHAAEVFDNRRVSPLLMDNVITFYRKQVPLQLAGCVVDALFVPRQQVRYPMAVNILDDGAGYVVGFEYVEQLADVRPLACLEAVLRTSITAPETPLDEIGVLEPDEDSRLDRLLNQHRTYPVQASLDAWLSDTVRRHPDRVAVSDSAGAWTYAELDSAVSRVAATLRVAGCGPAVAVAAHRRRELVAVLLGVLRSGRGYVPLDPHAPPQRIRYIVEQFGGAERLCLVADPDLLPDAPTRLRITVDDAVAGPGQAGQQPATDAGAVVEGERVPGADDVAYTIFTSGSTGVPKGVEVTHRNVMRLVASADDRYDFGPDDVWCLFHSYAFDVSVWEIFGSLLHGARLHVVPDDTVRSPIDVARLLADEKVTVLNQTPSAFRRLVGVLTPELADRLAVRWVVFAGEAFQFDLLRPWLDLVGGRARLVNMYGITETTVHTTYYEVDPALVGVERASVIGTPLGDLSLAVVDRNLNRCPVGVPGELLVAGPGVARGYRNLPRDTARRFLRDGRYGEVAYRSGDRVVLRADGNLVYLDRIDRQVQLRGYRVELGEVENALRALPEVKDTYVGMRSRPDAEPFLVAWLVTSGEPTDADLRDQLRDRLPGYMVPAVFVRVEQLPLTVNGKVDAGALPVPARPVATGAVTGVAGKIADIWLETVQCAPVGPDDNFFDVGGTSMHVARIHARLVEELGAADLTMLELFEYPTPRALAERIDRVTADGPSVGSRRRPGAAAGRRRAVRIDEDGGNR